MQHPLILRLVGKNGSGSDLGPRGFQSRGNEPRHKGNHRRILPSSCTFRRERGPTNLANRRAATRRATKKSRTGPSG